MSILTIAVEKPGLLSLVQDQGRVGHQALGVPVGGALDRLSARMANWLVSNPLNHPVIELTLMGPQLQFDCSCQIALTGADLSPKVHDLPVVMNQTLNLNPGDRLSFGRCKTGCRSYLAIGGTWQMDSWLGSYGAAHPQAQRLTPNSVLQKGSHLTILPTAPIPTRTLEPFRKIAVGKAHGIRVLEGPEFALFTRSSIGHFFSNPYRVSADSNRMGYRLEGPNLHLEEPVELISSGIVPGTIQVANSGQALALLADAQTTGGYPRIANIIQADLDIMGQIKPGDLIQFHLTPPEVSRNLLLAQKQWEEILQ